MSSLREAAEEYLALRRALGFKLRQQGRMLLQFVEFLEQRDATVISTELALQWACEPPGESRMWCHQRLVVVRGFAQHRAAWECRRNRVGLIERIPRAFDYATQDRSRRRCSVCQ